MRLSKYVPATLAVIACVAYDPDAAAAEPKRALLVLFALVCMCLPRQPAVEADRARHAPHAALRFGVAFLALSAISFLWGRSSGVLDLATWCGAAVIGFTAARDDALDARRAAQIVALFVAAIVSAWALFAFAMGHRGFGVHAGQGNPNWLGMLLAIALPLSLDWPVGRGRVLAMAAVAIEVPALFVSHSRVGWAAAGIAAVLVVGSAAFARRREAVLMIVSLGIGCAFAGAIAATERPKGAVARTSVAAEVVDAADRQTEATPVRSWEGRVWIWRNAIDAARTSMPMGVGLGGFGHAYLDAQGKRLAALQPRSAARHFVNATTAHQDFLQIAVESGPLAVLALVACLSLATLALLRAGWIQGAASLVAFAIAMMGDSPMRQPGPCVLVCLVLFGLPKGEGRAPLRWSRILIVSVLLAHAGLLAVATQQWLVSRLLTAAERADPRKREILLSRATSLAPRSGEAQLARGLHLLALGQGSESFISLMKSDDQLANAGTRTAIGEARLVEGSSVAADGFHSALQWHPGSLRARMGVAEAYRRTGKLALAEEHARIAVSLAPGESRAVELLESILAERIDAQ